MADKPKVIIKQDVKTGTWRDGAGKFTAPPIPKKPKDAKL